LNREENIGEFVQADVSNVARCLLTLYRESMMKLPGNGPSEGISKARLVDIAHEEANPRCANRTDSNLKGTGLPKSLLEQVVIHMFQVAVFDFNLHRPMNSKVSGP
jgi:hypothetical protein